MSQDYPFTTDTAELTAIAIAYQNKKMIASEVAPVVKVADESFKYLEFGKEAFSVPETEVGRKGAVQEVNFTATSRDGSTKDHGLKTKIADKDITKAKAIDFNIVGANTESLTQIITLRHEIEVATMIQDVNNYAVANRETLSGTDQWNDPTSDPVRNILVAMENSLVPFTIASMGSVVWNYLRLHPKVIEFIYGTNANSGKITKAAFAEAFELEMVLVGQARVNTANIKQAPVMARAWGNDFALQHRDMTANTMAGTTFAYTASWQPHGTERHVATKVLEQMEFGVDGGLQVGVGEHKQALVTANDYGYIIKDATTEVFE